MLREKIWFYQSTERLRNQTFENNLRPIIDVMRSPKKNNLGKSVESLKIIIPIIAVPSAPIPVQTA